MTIGEIKDTTRSDLYDAGVTFYAQEDLDDSCQDAYDDVLFQTQCLVKRIPGLPWHSKMGYINFIIDYNIGNFMGCTAIFNNNSNCWLRDDVSLRDFDKLRVDWEKWTGQPQMWAPVTSEIIVVTPRMFTGSGTFDLIYCASAPHIPNDTHVPLIATDMQVLLEYYMTADMLEQAQEYTKAAKWWDDYYAGIITYASRCKNLAKKDLLLTI